MRGSGLEYLGIARRLGAKQSGRAHGSQTVRGEDAQAQTEAWRGHSLGTARAQPRTRRGKPPRARFQCGLWQDAGPTRGSAQAQPRTGARSASDGHWRGLRSEGPGATWAGIEPKMGDNMHL